MPPIRNLTGLKFNYLTAIKPVQNSDGRYVWVWRCDCGKEIKLLGSIVTRKQKPQKSCNECYQKRRLLHGKTNTKEFFAWRGILSRCRDSGSKPYKDYGGRGIKVCDRWLEFKNFYEDMGDAPTKKHSIDRINNDGDYCKENCRWATGKEQCRNQRKSRIIEYNGEKRPLPEWVELYGLNYNSLYNRLRRGWTFDRAINQEVIKRK